MPGQKEKLSIASPSLKNRRVFISTVPFGDPDQSPIQLLEQEGIEFGINSKGRRLKEEVELLQEVGDASVLIAGTEQLGKSTLSQLPNLRLISRVGIGLDNVDLEYAKERNILVSYTPDAPSPAVAELTIGLMLALLRHIPNSDRGLRNGVWHRFHGRRLSELTVGIIGVGRIGKRVINHLSGFGCQILANDLCPVFSGLKKRIKWVEKEYMYRHADIISLHVPLTRQTRNMISKNEFQMMKPGTILINTARGTIVHEEDLYDVLKNKYIAGAAVDVFSKEPYSGPLIGLENCLLTCHMGSMTYDCRAKMELEATEEAVRFLKGEPLLRLVAEAENLTF